MTLEALVDQLAAALASAHGYRPRRRRRAKKPNTNGAGSGPDEASQAIAETRAVLAGADEAREGPHRTTADPLPAPICPPPKKRATRRRPPGFESRAAWLAWCEADDRSEAFEMSEQSFGAAA